MRRRLQIEFVAERLDNSILKSLGFPLSVRRYLSRHAAGALSPEASLATAVTFRKFFVTTCRSLPIRDHREQLARAALTNGCARRIVTQVVAGEVDRWIRRDLLAPQDLLVDVPHLFDAHAVSPRR